MNNLLYMQTLVFDPLYFKSGRYSCIEKTEQLFKNIKWVTDAFSDNFHEIDISYKDICNDGKESILWILNWFEINKKVKYKTKNINITKVFSDKRYFYYIW